MSLENPSPGLEQAQKCGWIKPLSFTHSKEQWTKILAFAEKVEAYIAEVSYENKAMCMLFLCENKMPHIDLFLL